MDLRQFVTALRKGWWLIAICAVVGLGLAFAYSLQVTPRYSSTVTFFVSTPTADGTSPLSADQFATRRITSYVGLLSSDVVAQRIIDDTHVDLDVSDVSRAISGEADLNTVLLTATVIDTDPQRSLLIAEGIAKDFGDIVNEVDPIGPGQVELRVISGPTLNPTPVSPRMTVNVAIGLVGGIAVGVIVALLRQVLDTTVRNTRTLSTITRPVPVLGIIPFDRESRKNPLILERRSQSIQAEAFRHLRTSIQFLDFDKRNQVIVVTSNVADEGKSTTSINLAISFCQAGRKVLLIEADLRRPRVASYLGIEGSVGLTNFLVNQVELSDVLQEWGTIGLTVLPSGGIPPNPSELLGSRRMAELISTLRRGYDTIIVDAPPVLPVTDAAVVSAHVDGLVLVVRYGKATRSQVSTAVRSLRTVDARLLGTVLNGAPRGGQEGYDAYGSAYYSASARGAPSLDEIDAAPVVPVSDVNRKPRQPASDMRRKRLKPPP